jgi:voltage-gated potassium channel
MTVVSLTSVGYHEIVDTSTSPALRIFNIFVLVFGLGIMLYVFSIATAFVVEGDLKRLFWKNKMLKRIKDLRNHTIVCGAGVTGMRVIEELYKTRRDIVVIDKDPARLTRIEQFGEIPVVEGDADDEETLEMAGLDYAGGVIAALPSDKDNLVVVVTVRQKHANVRIVARCVDPKMADKMIRAGASSTVSPNSIGGMRLASEMVRPHVVTFLDMMLRDTAATLRIEEISIPFHSTWVGRSLGDLGLRERYNLGCLALRDPGKDSFHYNPHDAEVCRANSVVVVMGNVDDIYSAREAAVAEVVRKG